MLLSIQQVYKASRVLESFPAILIRFYDAREFPGKACEIFSSTSLEREKRQGRMKSIDERKTPRNVDEAIEELRDVSQSER